MGVTYFKLHELVRLFMILNILFVLILFERVGACLHAGVRTVTYARESHG